MGQVTLDTTPPGLVGLAVVGPSILGPGATTAIEVEVAEALSEPPDVTLEPRGTRWACPEDAGPPKVRCTLDLGADAEEGRFSVAMRAVDLAGNVGHAALPDAVVLDFTPPTLTEQPVLRNPLARPGAVIGVTLAVSEPLDDAGAAAALRPTGGGDPVPLAPAGHEGLTWAFRRVAERADEGTWTLVVPGLRDEAGNTGPPLELPGAFRVDGTPPALTAPLQWDRDPPLYRRQDVARLTFSLDADLAPDTLSVQLDLAPAVELSCVSEDAGYACDVDLATHDGIPSDGTLVVGLSASDLAGNRRSEHAELVVDSTAPSLLLASATPTIARPGDTVLYSLRVSEPLGSGLPTLVTTRDGERVDGMPGEPLLAEATRFTWAVPIGEGMEGRYEVTVQLVDPVGNASGSLRAGSFAVDGTPPAFTSEPRLTASRLGPGDRVEVSFEVSEDLEGHPPTAVIASSPPEALACARPDPQGAPRRYVCTQEQGIPAEPSAEWAAPVLVEIRDAVGNGSTATLVAVLDTLPPSLSGSARFERCDGYEPARLGEADLWLGDAPPCAAGAPHLTATLSVSEPLSEEAPPMVEVAGRPLALLAASVDARQVSFGYTPDGGEPTDPQGAPVDATLVDAVGNSASLALGTLRFDFSPPRLAGDPDPGLSHVRAPWGSEASGGRPGVQLEVAGDTFDEAGELRVHADALPGDEPVGEASFVPGQALVVEIVGYDPAILWVSFRDRAGNPLDPDDGRLRGGRARVEAATWVATLGGKVLGDPATNPHDLSAATPPAGVGLDPRADAWALGQADVEAAGRRDEQLVEATSSLAPWRRIGGPDQPAARRGHALAYDAGRARVVLFGGREVSGEPCAQGADGLCSDTWEWDGATWVLRQPPESPPPVEGHVMVWHPAHRRVLLLGGLDAAEGLETWTWDGYGWLQRHPLHAPTWRRDAALAYDAARERVVLFGGADQGANTCWDGEFPFCADTWLWDGEDWSEADVAAPPPSRAGHALAYDAARERVVLFGGQSMVPSMFPELIPPERAARGQTWEWDGAGWNLASLDGPLGRYAHALVPSPEGAGVTLAGGYGVAAWGDDEPTPDAWTWDGETWRQHGEPVLAHDAGAAWGFDPVRLRIVRFGTTEGARATVEGNTERWTQHAPNPGPRRRADQASAYDPLRQRLVIFGGPSRYANQDQAAATWEWDGAAWLRQRPPQSPQGRDGHAMLWNPTTERVVMFGGADDGGGVEPDGELGGLWSWDGETWDAVEPAVRPAARYDHAMAFDPGRERLVLFGGVLNDRDAGIECGQVGPGGAVCGDTWEWDGQQWARIVTNVRPAAQSDHAMVGYQGGVLLYGGKVPGVGGGFGHDWETWAWDGVQWRDLQASRLAIDNGAAGVLDTWRGRPVIAGGSCALHECADTWEWMGGDWQRADGASPLPAVDRHTLSFDPVRGRLLVWGGSSSAADSCLQHAQGPGACQELWAREPANVRPQLVVDFDLAASGLVGEAAQAPAGVEELTLRGRVGGLGHRPPGEPEAGADVPGFEVLAFAPGSGGWAPLGAPGSGTPEDLEDWTVTLPADWVCDAPGCDARLPQLLGETGRLTLMLSTLAPQGRSTDEARLALDSLELQVRFHHGGAP